MSDKSCAFTGHRPKNFPWKYNEADPRCLSLKEVLTEQITTLAKNGVADFLSGTAEATNTWAALSVLALHEKNPALKLHCILPCKTRRQIGRLPRGKCISLFWSRRNLSCMSAGITTEIVCWNATIF